MNQLTLAQCILISQHSANYWSTVDQGLNRCLASINWDVNWVLIEMLTKGMDWHWTVDALSTNDPINVHEYYDQGAEM